MAGKVQYSVSDLLFYQYPNHLIEEVKTVKTEREICDSEGITHLQFDVVIRPDNLRKYHKENPSIRPGLLREYTEVNLDTGERTSITEYLEVQIESISICSSATEVATVTINCRVYGKCDWVKGVLNLNG